MITTPRNYIKTLSTLHLAMAAGPLLVTAFFYFNTELETNGTASDIYVYVFPIIALIGIFSSKFIFNLLIKKLKTKETLQAKLAGYQSASLIKFALIEGPALLNIVWFSQTGNLLYLTIGGVLILFLFMQRPKTEKIETDLELNSEHKRQFHKLDEPI